MIYFDNAATTWPKPQSVINAVSESMKYMAANPGRSGHKMALAAGEKIYECRELISTFFGLENPCNVIFTLNATHALNIVINGFLNEGDHVIYTQMDHNSVLRPVHALSDKVEISAAMADSEGAVSLSEIENLIKQNTRLIIMTHISNVCGTVEPIAEVGALAHKHGIHFLVDASQSAGVIDINMKRDNIDFLAFPGHKSLYGPMGTGVLCIASDKALKPLIQGGTGSYSHLMSQPDELPDKFESGTLNFPGICGLAQGVRFVSSLGINNINKHEIKLTEYLLNGINEIKDFKVIGKNNTKNRSGVVSLVHQKIPSTNVADYLSTSFNIATRAMYHCAYPSHVALGTEDSGTVRISFGVFNTLPQVKTLLYALEHIQA